MSESLPTVGRGFAFEALHVGFRFRTHRRTIAEADVAAFVNLTWLTEELFAVADDASRAIKGRPVPGALVYSFAEGLLLPTMQDTGLAFLNATLDVTLAANQAATAVTDARLSASSFLGFCPLTANAAAEIGNGTLYVSAQGKGTATLAHANTAQTDRNFRLLVIG